MVGALQNQPSLNSHSHTKTFQLSKCFFKDENATEVHKQVVMGHSYWVLPAKSFWALLFLGTDDYPDYLKFDFSRHVWDQSLGMETETIRIGPSTFTLNEFPLRCIVSNQAPLSI